MLADSYILPQCYAGQRSLGGLITLYESNFIKLLALTGGLQQLRDNMLSSTATDFPLRLSIDEASKYTRVLRLTYLIDDADEGRVLEPDLRLRVYLDARLTEVLGWARRHRHAALASLRRRCSRELDLRWSRNIMLSKWLDYLQDRGHSFELAGASSPLAACLPD